MNTPRPDHHIVQRAVDELRRLPDVDPSHIRRVVRAAAEARVSPADEPNHVRAARIRSIRTWAAVAIATAAGVVGFVARGLISTDRSPVLATAEFAKPSVVADSAPRTRLVSALSADAAPILEQFVFEDAHARRVSVVGDFNNWNSKNAPMVRSQDGGFWSVIVPITPGRHMYGFMVDDSLFVLDPRALTARDPDLGSESSVRMVGRRPGGQ